MAVYILIKPILYKIATYCSLFNVLSMRSSFNIYKAASFLHFAQKHIAKLFFSLIRF